MKSPAPALTPHQTEVVRLISLGCTNEEAANILGLAISTVGNHKAAAMKMFGTDKATYQAQNIEG